MKPLTNKTPSQHGQRKQIAISFRTVLKDRFFKPKAALAVFGSTIPAHCRNNKSRKIGPFTRQMMRTLTATAAIVATLPILQAQINGAECTPALAQAA